MLVRGLPPVKFLIVDDREENLFAISQILRRDAVEIVTARTGRAALEALLKSDFALAIIDVQMPEMDGLELAELMRSSERTQHVPIVLITAGLREPSRLFRGYEAGAVDFLYKPVEPVLLRNKADTFFELFRQRQLLARQLELLREAEEFRASILGATRDEMLLLDLDGRVAWVNPGARLFGSAEQALPIRSQWLDCWCEAARGWARSSFESACEDRVERFVGQVAPAWGTAWLDVVLTPVHAANGAVARLLAIGRDITEQRLAQSERERLTLKLEETLRLNELFVAAVGHDLRNPLAAIVNASGLMARQPDSAEVVRLAQASRHSAKRMQRMTEALLDLSRARLNGGLPIEPGPLDLAPLAERVLEEQRLTAPTRDLSLRLSGDLRGKWDGTRLEQVLSNLLGNAVQHGLPDGPVELRLIEERDQVVIETENAGVIPERALEELFDPFRARPRRKRSDGLGLGLFIVQQVAIAHGGRVEVTSSARSGTRFRVCLPK